MGAFKYYASLSRKGGSQQKITEDHDHRGEGGMQKIGKSEGAHIGNTNSQDQLSVGGSRGDIFIDQQ